MIHLDVQPDSEFTATNRRKVLKSLGATAGVIGLAGCSQGGNGNGTEGDEDTPTDEETEGGSDEATRLNLTVPPSGTVSTQSATALQRALREESDTVRLNLQEVSGDPSSIQEFAAGNSVGHTVGLDNQFRAKQGKAPFDESVEPRASQVFTIGVLNLYWVAVDGSGIETFDDLVEADSNVWVFPPEWGMRRMMLEMFETVGIREQIEDRILNIGLGDVAGAISEGRLKSFMVYGANYQSIAGWLTEVDARADLHIIEGTETFTNAVKEYPGLSPEEIEPVGWEQDITDVTSTTTSIPVPYALMLGDKVSDDVVREICNISHNNLDVIKEGYEYYLDHSEVENMSGYLYDELDIHSGAKAFYEEQK